MHRQFFIGGQEFTAFLFQKPFGSQSCPPFVGQLFAYVRSKPFHPDRLLLWGPGLTIGETE